jgi:hypothetical protein
MWTIKEGQTPGLKFEHMVEMKSRLLDLKRQIKEIASIDVNINSPMAPENNYDVILQCELRSWADLELYQKHPAHIEVAEYIKNIRDNRAAIDFEIKLNNHQ